MSRLLQFPPQNAPAVDGKLLARSWVLLFRQMFDRLGGAPGQPPESITVGSSPFSYTSSANGFMDFQGSGIGSISFTRGSVTVSVSSNGLIPMRTGDKVTLTWSGSSTPSMTFFPD